MSQNNSHLKMELKPIDLSPYRESNTGVDFVHTFDSGKAGPHVLVNALTKGNEFCGVGAICFLLDGNIRPVRGKLTLSFANVDAYERFDPKDPEANKFIDLNFNRIWADDILDSGDAASEIKRARQMRPVIGQADYLLDLLSNCHLRDSDEWNDPPMLAYIEKPAARQIAVKMKFPLHQIGCHPSPQGGMLYEYGRFRDVKSPAAGLLAECGPHFDKNAEANAIQVALRFLNACGTIEPETAQSFNAVSDAGKVSVYTDMLLPFADTDSFRFAGEFRGYEEFSKGDLIAVDGEKEIRAPYNNCVLIAVAENVRKGDGIGHLIRRIETR